jgi:hypothetical protein
VEAAWSDISKGIAESTLNGRVWISREIIQANGWGAACVADFVAKPSTHSYCGDTVRRWWRLAGFPGRGLASVGKILYEFVSRDRLGVAFKPTSGDTIQPGDILLHQKEPGSWHGHVMMVLRVDGDKLLIAEGNSTQSMGPNAGYQAGGRGYDMSRREGVGFRWLSVDDAYLSWVVRPFDSNFEVAK